MKLEPDKMGMALLSLLDWADMSVQATYLTGVQKVGTLWEGRGGSAMSGVLIKLRALHFLSQCKPVFPAGPP